LATTFRTPNHDQRDVNYDLFVHEVGTAIVLRYADQGVRLVGNRIGWRVGGADKELPLSDIAAIHLTTEVSSPTTSLGTSVCQISFKNGAVLSVMSTNSLGLDKAGFAARYRAFVTDLHARLNSEQRALIAFSAGRGGVRYGFALLATVLLGVGVIAIVVFGAALGILKLRTLITVFLGAGLVVAMLRFSSGQCPARLRPSAAARQRGIRFDFCHY
jgi:hypothetical protein